MSSRIPLFFLLTDVLCLFLPWQRMCTVKGGRGHSHDVRGRRGGENPHKLSLEIPKFRQRGDRWESVPGRRKELLLPGPSL